MIDFGCVGSSFPREGPLQPRQAGATPHRDARASLVAEHRLQTRRLSSCGSGAQPLRGMRDPPRPGPEPVSPAPAGRPPTTAPPGKPRLWSFNPLLLRLLGDISLSLLCSYSSWGSALYLDPPLRVGRLRASVPRPDRTGLKGQLLRGLWLTQAGGREGYGCGASLQRQRLAGSCSSLRCTMRSPGEVVAGSRDPGSGKLHRLPGGMVWIVTCACT